MKKNDKFGILCLKNQFYCEINQLQWFSEKLKKIGFYLPKIYDLVRVMKFGLEGQKLG